ncbi:MAG: hypothetical protein AAB581_01755 [Patescibacteria group bacterium]
MLHLVKSFVAVLAVALCLGGVHAPSAHASFAFSPIPDGALVRAAGPEVYVLDNGMVRWIPNPEVFNGLGYAWESIHGVTSNDLEVYPRGKDVAKNERSINGTVVRAADEKIYVIKNGKRQWVRTPRDFENLGLDWSAVIQISGESLKKISEGKPIEQPTLLARPLGMLLKKPEQTVEEFSVKFEFSGVAAANMPARKLSFDTFVEGVDTRWVTTASQQRTVSLPKKAGIYTFFLRAKDQNGVAERVPKQYTFAVNASPHYGDIIISGANPRTADLDAESITLVGKSQQPVALAGWTLESKQYHTSFIIPAEVYTIPDHPYYEQKVPLVLRSGDKAVIYTAAGELGVNFRLNKCVGYLSAYHTFTPALPHLCPRPKTDEIRKFSAYCQRVISSLGNCKEPDLNDQGLEIECRQYMKERFNYSKCVENNNQFYDFYLNEWRVYLNRPKEIWTNTGGDTIFLNDENGLMVAQYTYR